MNEEQAAIARLKKGDIAGLEGLVRQYQVVAVHTAYLIIGERPSAEDVVQSAFLKAAEKIGQFDASRPFKPWFLRIVTHDAIKYAQRQQRHWSLDEALENTAYRWLLAPDPTPAELAETEDARQAVWRALQQLPPEQRAAIVLRHFLDMDETEMIRELNRPLSTIKWWLHAARKRLRVLLKSPENGDQSAKTGHRETEPGDRA